MNDIKNSEKNIELKNMFPRNDLAAESKRRNSEYEYASVDTTELSHHEAEGWEIVSKRGKYKSKIKRCKPNHVYTEDLVWTILYRMGFSYLCGKDGAVLCQGTSVRNQLDACAYDHEATVVVECKSAEELKGKDNFNHELNTLEIHRQKVGTVLRVSEPQVKRRVGAIMVLHNYTITDMQRQRACENNVLLLDAEGLSYYLELSNHIGEAARYQLYAELFANQEVEGLNLVLPAVQTSVGKKDAYTFTITPEHLLKIAFVAHKGRGDNGAAGMGAYQRMVNKSRLASIRKYIDDGGIFPTNIIVNFNPKKEGGASGLRFEQTKQSEDALPNVKLGWLHLPPRYQCAWIIDGQHRLLAYSGHDKASKSFLSITAYDGLEVHEQLRLFTTINSQQKKVPGNLLVELYASLNWHSDNEKEQMLSIISKAIQRLNNTMGTPFYGRILMDGDTSSNQKCISIKSIYDALRHGKFYLADEKNGKTLKYGALWQHKQEATLKRTEEVLTEWFCKIAQTAPENWDLGKADGGYLATNNGVVVCIGILRSVMEFLDKSGFDCVISSTKNLVERVIPYAVLVGEYFATLTENEMRQIRRKFGDGGQTEVRYMVMREIRKHKPEFNPPGLVEWIERQADENREDALRLLYDIEQRIRACVISTMQEEIGDRIEDWWLEVPEQVRRDVAVAREQDNRVRGDEAAYLGYNDIRKIALDHWTDLFRSKLGYGTTGNKIQRTQWLEDFDKIQKRLPKQGSKSLQKDEYDNIIKIDEWLEGNQI